MNRQIKKQKDTIITFCEGEAEVNLFAFLKNEYSNNNINFPRTVNLEGVYGYADFVRKYNKKMKEQGIKPKKDFANVRYLFVIDNDLEDSKQIADFLKKENHLLQLCDPNTEGVLLELVGKKQIRYTAEKDFRKKCKDNFKNHYKCEAHKLKGIILKSLFSDISILKRALPILHGLFSSK